MLRNVIFVVVVRMCQVTDSDPSLIPFGNSHCSFIFWPFILHHLFNYRLLIAYCICVGKENPIAYTQRSLQALSPFALLSSMKQNSSWTTGWVITGSMCYFYYCLVNRILYECGLYVYLNVVIEFFFFFWKSLVFGYWNPPQIVEYKNIAWTALQ